MITKPLFSVVIPTFNRAEALKRCLLSLEKQTFKDFEVIVCDSSSDHTKNVVESFTRKMSIQYYWEASFNGPATPRNSGIRLARADFIAFLDADDWWYPHKLESVKKYLTESDVIFHDLDICSRKGKSILRK